MGCKILKIGVFFDGTGNTKGPDSSKGQMSNVAKLSELYRDEEFKNEKGKEITSKMLYTNGVGTYDSDIEDFFNPIDRKYDKGGGRGGAKRIYKMIDDVINILNVKLYDLETPNGYAKREIDVFGFSRGAAMARDFVNTFFADKINLESEEYGDVKFNFIGIYNAVGSFGKPGNSVDMKPKREYLKYVDEATKKAQEIADGLNVKIKESLKDYVWYVDDVNALGVVDVFENKKHIKKYKVTLAKEVNNALSHHSARDPAKKFDHKTPDVSTYDGVVHDEPESGNDARYVNPFGGVVDGRKKNASHLTLYVQREIFNNNPNGAIVAKES